MQTPGYKFFHPQAQIHFPELLYTECVCVCVCVCVRARHTQRQRPLLFLHLVNPPSSQLQQLSPSHCEWRINLDVWMSVHIWFALVNPFRCCWPHSVHQQTQCWYVGVCVSSLTSLPAVTLTAKLENVTKQTSCELTEKQQWQYGSCTLTGRKHSALQFARIKISFFAC